MSDNRPDFKYCILCQRKKEESLIENPVSHERLLQFVEERSGYGDPQYSAIWSQLQGYTPHELALQDATWHRTCYQDATHAGKLKRAKDKFEKEDGPTRSKRTKEETGKLTRSKTCPYNKDVCFFCDQAASHGDPLHSVSTTSAGKSIWSAVQILGDAKLQTKLATSIDTNDAHAIDVKYHKNCYLTNVTNVMRRSQSKSSDDSALAAAKVEFLDVTEKALGERNPVNMAVLEALYIDVLHENNVANPSCSRKTLKQLISSYVPDVEFHRPKRLNEPERVTVKETRDDSILSYEEDCSKDTGMKSIYDAAAMLRKCINQCKNWEFTGRFDDIGDKHLPKELYCFFRWVVQGPKAFTSVYADDKFSEVHKRAVCLAQSTISMTLTERQVKNQKSEVLRVAKEMPQHLAIGLAIRQAIRSKELVNFLHGFGMSVEYNRILRVEAQIEKHTLRRMERSDGLYIPPDFVPGRHVFFAVDNVDFAEDTPDGKRTLHGTAMAIYQRKDDQDPAPELRLEGTNTTGRIDRSIKDLPETRLLECTTPTSNPKSTTYPSYALNIDDLPITVKLKDFAWLLSRSLTRIQGGDVEDTNGEMCPFTYSSVPVWSGYNSLVHETQPITRIGAPPLLAAPAHEWSTLLTVFMQAQGITAHVMGPGRKTVISLDLGLYQPAKKLQMARNDLNHLILRPGELHIVMAQLRTLGSFIENSGVDLCWSESDLYGPTTVKQILEGKHVKRGEVAHMVTLQVLFMLYQKAFLSQQDPETVKKIEDCAKHLGKACDKGTKKEVQEATEEMVEVMKSVDVIGKMERFDEGQNPEFQVFRSYMKMIMEMMLFVRAVRTGDWQLHLTTLELFTKYFFAHDRLNYARMIPLYLAEMRKLPESAPEVYKEFLDGNWVVNKNQHVAFCGLGADHALEQINRSMKVSGGLVGITLNPNARTKFFLIAPELARLAEEAKEMAGTTKTKEGTHHHTLTVAVLSREEKNIGKLLNTMESFTNPFTQQGNKLFNLVTKVVVPEKVQNDLVGQSEIGQKLYDAFVKDRIVTGRINLWSPMKKKKLQTWKSMNKKIKVSSAGETVELQEDRNLFARMMIICKSRPEIDIQEAVGTYEFRVVPRSMFTADGTMLHCPAKSALMPILEKLPSTRECSVVGQEEQRSEQQRLRVSIVDAMAEVQSLDKPDWIRNCSQLAHHFTDRIFEKYGGNDEIRLIFDRYDIPASLKEATRQKRTGQQDLIYYRITPSTLIAKVTMKKLLSHTNTKNELAKYLAEETIQYAERNGARVVVAYGCECKGTERDMSYLNSNQEEADTKILLHALDATANGATEIQIHSPDTDVFILSLRRFPDLCHNTVFVTGKGQNHRTIKLKPIVRALGPLKTAALPSFHALSGADNTGSFAKKGKPTCWSVFNEASDEVIQSISQLGTSNLPSDDSLNAVEKFVCQLFLPKTDIYSLKALRWWLFTKKQARSQQLPPTKAALHQAVLRAHYQLLVWNNDRVANPVLPSPENYGWSWEEAEKAWTPVMTTFPPAPQAIIHLVKCKCAKDRCANNRCQCRKAGLKCTDLCVCSVSGDDCKNKSEEDSDDDDDDDYDDSDDDDDDSEYSDIDEPECELD